MIATGGDVLVVSASKPTAGDQRDPERGEIILADLNIIRRSVARRAGGAGSHRISIGAEEGAVVTERA